MRLGENNRNLTEEEKNSGQRAARTLRRDMKTILQASTVSRTGTMLKTLGTSVRMKFDALDSVAIKASSLTFIQHYGFEKRSSNKARFTMKPYEHFDKLFDKTNALETLLTEVAELRGEEVAVRTANIISVSNGR